MESKNPSSKIKDKLAQMQREAEERDAKRRGEKTGAPYIDLSATSINIEAVALILEEEAKKAINDLQDVEYDNSRIVVKEAEPRESRPKRTNFKPRGDFNSRPPRH